MQWTQHRHDFLLNVNTVDEVEDEAKEIDIDEVTDIDQDTEADIDDVKVDQIVTSIANTS